MISPLLLPKNSPGLIKSNDHLPKLLQIHNIPPVMSTSIEAEILKFRPEFWLEAKELFGPNGPSWMLKRHTKKSKRTKEVLLPDEAGSRPGAKGTRITLHARDWSQDRMCWTFTDSRTGKTYITKSSTVGSGGTKYFAFLGTRVEDQGILIPKWSKPVAWGIPGSSKRELDEIDDEIIHEKLAQQKTSNSSDMRVPIPNLRRPAITQATDSLPDFTLESFGFVRSKRQLQDSNTLSVSDLRRMQTENASLTDNPSDGHQATVQEAQTASEKGLHVKVHSSKSIDQGSVELEAHNTVSSSSNGRPAFTPQENADFEVLRVDLQNTDENSQHKLADPTPSIINEYQLANTTIRYTIGNGRYIPVSLKRLIRGAPEIGHLLDTLAAAIFRPEDRMRLDLINVCHPWREKSGQTLTTTMRRSDPESLEIFLKDLSNAPIWTSSANQRCSILVDGETTEVE